MDTTQIPEPFYILATGARAGDLTRVLKQGETFAVFDRSGAIRPGVLPELGLYHEGTRHLSALEATLEGEVPQLLSSGVRRDGVLIFDLTNPDLEGFPGGLLPRDTVHVFGLGFLWDGALRVRFRFHNYGPRPLDLAFGLRFAADYADVFEVRGAVRPSRGHRLDPELKRGTAVLGYEGLDGRVRRTRLAFSPEPEDLDGGAASFRLPLPPRGETTVEVAVSCEAGRETRRTVAFGTALERATAALEERRTACAAVETSNAQFDEWLDRSLSDLQMMITDTPHGPYPYAGVPWYSAAFGRDGIFAAYEMLWLDPSVARGVLSFLAATQAREPEAGSESGQIVHEIRSGEMAALGEVPFGRHYGAADATPLFVVLAGAYQRRTGDLGFVEGLWPSLERALAWIQGPGDPDGDGFVESAQGWRDSAGALFHRDGAPAEGPYALCEVQAYAYAARREAARLARLLDRGERGRELDDQAEELRQRFERAFWCEEVSTYCAALDAAKTKCQVRTSAAGHALFGGIASPNRAWRVAHTLLNESSFSGWGVRTLDSSEARYNPMSYHNGSVWPHDNALIAQGMSRYGRKDGAVKILSGLFDASAWLEHWRMPELFCGFHRRPHEGPTLYSTACAPQACAAGSVFLLLQACLGLEIDGGGRRICFNRPELPESLDCVKLRGLQVADATVDLSLERHGQDVALHIERREGEVEVLVVK